MLRWFYMSYTFKHAWAFWLEAYHYKISLYKNIYLSKLVINIAHKIYFLMNLFYFLDILDTWLNHLSIYIIHFGKLSKSMTWNRYIYVNVCFFAASSLRNRKELHKVDHYIRCKFEWLIVWCVKKIPIV